MGPEATPPAVPQPVAKRIHRRAAHACQRCRMRKVRCDVSIRGTPCMNCSLDGGDCEVNWSRRARRYWRAQGVDTKRRSTETRLAHPASSDKNADENSDNGREPDQNDGSARGIEDAFLSSIAEDTRGENVLWKRADTVLTSSYIGYSYYPFLVISNLSSIPPQDFQFLELQGCLHVPCRPILDEFIRHYFLHMHPILPILDEGIFWDMYAQRPNPRKPDQKFSLLLFQAMLFTCCSFISPIVLNQLGPRTARDARAVFYRRAKLLFNLETESSLITRSQAALLLTSWSFSYYDVPRKPTIPWLCIAIQHARDADAHNYRAFDADTEEHAVRKRLWWGCIIRDRIFSLGMRRSIQITLSHFDVTKNAHLSYYDLVGELHGSLVHDADTKIQLAEILELLVQLCVILTDILRLVFPIEDSLKYCNTHHEALDRVRNCQVALRKWHEDATLRLPNFGTPSEALKHHESVVLFSKLLSMYYYSTKVALGHYEILRIAITGTTSPTSSSDIITLKDNHFELQDAALGTTECLETLIHLELVRWLPVTAVSCIALPLLLHLLDVEILAPARAASSSHSTRMKRRLGILKKAMQIYQLQYEGIHWINGAIDRIISLARAGSTPDVDQSRRQVQLTASADDGVGLLTFQPVWYLRLAFTIDVAFGKGRLPEDDVFLCTRSFRDVVMAEISPSINLLRAPVNNRQSPYDMQQQTKKPKDSEQAAIQVSARAEGERTLDEPSSSTSQEGNLGREDQMTALKDLNEGYEELGNTVVGALDFSFGGGVTTVENEHFLTKELDPFNLCRWEGLSGSDLATAFEQLS